MKLYNTLARKEQIFRPIKKNLVKIYTCGPTVYNYAHIGNLRSYVFEDILKRTLLYNGYKAKHIMNITDVGHLTDDADQGEDKIEKGARREGKTAYEIAEFYTEKFKQNLEDLNIIPPNKYCKATDYIKEQLNLIKILDKKGFTYTTSDGVYFDTSKLKDYGKLAQLKKQSLKKGARVGMKEKRNLHDFALWKLSPKNSIRLMEWDSPYGIGFPGWHLECSAIASAELGQPFDIHCGGIDHIPVHHTNEIAQSEAAYGKPLANYWLHGEFLTVKDEKMSKSSGNFITLDTLKEKNFNPLAYRFLLLQSHYRKQILFNWKSLQAAQNGLENIFRQIASLKKGAARPDQKFKDRFVKIINNDLDTPSALALLQEVLKSNLPDKEKLATLLDFDRIFGLGFKNSLKKEKIRLPEEIKKIVKERDKARQEKKWKVSDELREELEKRGYRVEDTAQGSVISEI